jgi:hypothetical protein
MEFRRCHQANEEFEHRLLEVRSKAKQWLNMSGEGSDNEEIDVLLVCRGESPCKDPKHRNTDAGVVGECDDLKRKSAFINCSLIDQEVANDSDSLIRDGRDDAFVESNDDCHSASGKSTRTTGTTSSPAFFLSDERVRTSTRDYYEYFDSIFRLGKSDEEGIWDFLLAILYKRYSLGSLVVEHTEGRRTSLPFCQ